MYHAPAMRKTLYLYIFREIPPPFLLGMATFTFVLLMGRLLRLADMVVGKGVPLVDVLKMIIYLLPSFWQATIPMALLLAILLAFGRLSGNSEIIAMKACGVSLFDLLYPALSFAFLAFLCGTFINVYAIPWGNTSFKKLLIDVVEAKAAVAIKEKVFVDDFPGVVLYTDSFEPRTQTMSGLIIQDERNPKDPATIFARSGVIVADTSAKTVSMHLKQGSIHRTVDSTGYRMVEFGSYDLKINLDQGKKELSKSELDMSLAELRANLEQPGYDQRMKLLMRMEFQSRFALPFACFALTLVALPLGIQNRRSGKAAGFSTSIGILILYYVLLSAGKTLGERATLPPEIAIWLPNLIFIAIGIFLFRRAATEQPFPLFDLAANLHRQFRGLFTRGGKR
jgi:lipopolysaccharide export system permease protein